MKTNRMRIVMIVCSITIAMISCNNSPEKKAEKVEDAKEAVVNATNDLDKARKDSAEEYNQYKAASESRIRENDSLLVVLKARIKEEKKEARTAYEKDVNTLEEKNEKLKRQIREYKENDKSKWESFKLGFNQEMDALGQSISKLAHKNMDKK